MKSTKPGNIYEKLFSDYTIVSCIFMCFLILLIAHYINSKYINICAHIIIPILAVLICILCGMYFTNLYSYMKYLKDRSFHKNNDSISKLYEEEKSILYSTSSIIHIINIMNTACAFTSYWFFITFIDKSISWLIKSIFISIEVVIITLFFCIAIDCFKDCRNILKHIKILLKRGIDNEN